ncbi:hypothetical protein BH23ACT10_BH23ACT10_30960 [soil metagenome]
MTAFPPGFTADLRRQTPWPSLTDSVWRDPGLAAATYGRLFDLITGCLPSTPADVLEIGCVDAMTWDGAPGSYDTAIIARTLHHFADPAAVLANVARWLRPDGRIVCVDFAHDRFDRRSARWLASIVSLLASADAHEREHDHDRPFDDDPAHATRPPDDDPAHATRQVEHDWVRDHTGHDLRTGAELLDALRSRFRELSLTWHPYLYWEVATALRTPDDGRVATTVRRWERFAIAQSEIPALQFVYVGGRHAVAGSC